jgi:DNA-binding NarL/FixJ family response regulator
LGAPIVRIMVVEDYEPFRRFLASLVQKRPEWQIVCEVPDGAQAIQKAKELSPDLILLDIGLPELNGIEVARRIREIMPDSRILFVTQEPSLEIVREAFAIGARGYVLKAQSASELMLAVDAVLQGQRIVSSGFAERTFAGVEVLHPDGKRSRGTPPVTEP